MPQNNSTMELYRKTYANLKEVIPAIVFYPGSEEEWRVITPNHVPGIKSNSYYVSTHGRIASTLTSPLYSEPHIMSCSKNAKGYHQVTLRREDGVGRGMCVKIHRIMMVVFCYIRGCEAFEVDHIDGDKDNNFIWNLEWVIPKDNVNRGINVLNKPVFGNSEYVINRALSNDEARQLCIDFMNGFDHYELAIKYGVSIRYVTNILCAVQRPYLNNEFGTKQEFYNRGYKLSKQVSPIIKIL